MENNKRPMLIKMGDTIFDKIQAFYIDPENYPLSDCNEKIRQRWVMVVNLLIKAFSKVKIANMLERDYGISQAQAYIDIRNAENMFGNVIKTDQEAFRALWLEWTKDFLKRSRQNRDAKSEAKALDLLAKYGDLNADKLEFNPEKLENLEIKFAIPKELYKYLKLSENQGVDDSNLSAPIDIEYEDLDEDER